MVTFNSINKAPGVYVQEITLPGPIPGVSTSNGAFVGPAAMGPLFKPTQITSFEQFTAFFGGYLEDPYRVYVTHAVKGFFQEGGKLCYFVRVGTGVQASLNLLDQKTRTALVVTALKEGVAGNQITVKVDQSSLVPSTLVPPITVARASANIANTSGASAGQKTVTTTSAGDFDRLTIGDVLVLSSGANSENASIAGVAKDLGANTTTITMGANLSKDYTGGLAQPADLNVATAGAGQKDVVTSSENDMARFKVGDVVILTKGGGTETATIAVLANNAGAHTTTITMTGNLSKTYDGGKLTPAALRISLVGAAAGQRTVITPSAGDAAKFKPGDVILLSNGGNKERATLSNIAKDATANTTTLTVAANLTNSYTGGTLRVADLLPGQTKFRVSSIDKLEPGSYISLTQGATTEKTVVRLTDRIGGFITLDKPLANQYPLDVADVNIASMEFTLTIAAPGKQPEIFKDLSLDQRHSRYFVNLVTSTSVSINLTDPPATTPPTDNMPVTLAATNLGTAGSGVSGVDEDLKLLQTSHYHTGIDSLRKQSDVNLLCIPDAATDATFGPNQQPLFTAADTQDIQAYMVAHCEKMQDRFAILDSRRLQSGAVTPADVVAQRNALNSDNGYAALYFPWIDISNPFGKGKILVPPSGFTAGVFAKNDDDVGVYKAPANEPITSALSLEFTATDDEQGPLNEAGINVIRSFPGHGIKIWGARTIAPHDVTAWRFVNVRRLTTFIEKSIQEGTRFAVFQPNNLTLWQQIKRMVTDFLTQQWVDGALFGDTAEHAFRVRVDEIINPPSVTALGQLIVQVTIRPTTPAEFIVFQVIQDITGSTLQESTAA